MPDLTPAADRYISAMLRRDGRVPPQALDGVPEHERDELLRQYFLAHSGEFPVRYEDGVLTIDHSAASSYGAVPVPAAVPPPAAQMPGAQQYQPPGYPGPGSVAGVYPGPSEGKAMLDSKPAAGAMPRLLYLLPVVFGFLGGLIGWLIVRDENPRGGRNLLLVGVTVSIVTSCFSFAVAGSMGSVLRSMNASSTTWPSTGVTSARPAMYYFGTST